MLVHCIGYRVEQVFLVRSMKGGLETGSTVESYIHFFRSYLRYIDIYDDSSLGGPPQTDRRFITREAIDLHFLEACP